MTKVKICGITNSKDALDAAESGADYVGLLVEIGFSKDTVNREDAKEIIEKLPLEVEAVFVTYLQKAGEIIEIAKYVKPGLIQLHNDIDTKEVDKIRKSLPEVKLVKSISVVDGAVDEAKKYAGCVDYLLLDTKVKGKKGGTGKTHDWNVSAKIVKSVKVPVFLAGGLNPGNVSDAIEKVKPFAVDTNSGVKLKARVKDKEKMKKFVESVKR